MSFHIDSMGCGFDEGDDELFAMKLRDIHQLNELRHGACEDSQEMTAPWVDGNPSAEANDAFLSRPLRFVPIRDAEHDFEREFQQALALGF